VLKVALIDRIKPVVKSQYPSKKARIRATKRRLAKRLVPAIKRHREKSIPLRP